MIDPNTAYNTLPQLFPKEINLLDEDILVKSLSAMSALAALNTMITADTNNIFHTLNMMSPLYVPEAVASSRVEEIITTNESVYMQRALEEAGGDPTPAEKEVLRYTRALGEGYLFLEENGYLATNQYIAIQKKLEPNKAGIRKLPGTQLKDPKTGKVHYTPPDHERIIRDLLKNFEDIFNESASKHEVLARAAVLHYQFEAIHPFYDGNGRTGRILIPLYLNKQNILIAPLLFTSKYILENRDEYYNKLSNVTFKHEWKEWILYMLDAFEVQSEYTLNVLTKLQAFGVALRPLIRKLGSAAKADEILTLIYRNPYFTQRQFEDAVEVSPATARKYLLELEAQNIIKRRKQPKRNRYLYVCPGYVKLLKGV